MSASNHKVGSPINVWQSLANTFINQSTNLKQWWDQVGEIVRLKHDALCDYIDTDIATKAEVQNITLGQIADGTITTAKLDPNALQANVTKLTTATGNLYGVANVDDALKKIAGGIDETLPITLFNTGTVDAVHAVGFIGRDGVNVNTGTALAKSITTPQYYGQGYSFHMIKALKPKMFTANSKIKVTYTSGGDVKMALSQVPPNVHTLNDPSGSSGAQETTPVFVEATLPNSASSTTYEMLLNPANGFADLDEDLYLGFKMYVNGQTTDFINITKIEIIQG